MKTNTRLALLFAVTLPVALSAAPSSNHNSRNGDNHSRGWNTDSHQTFEYHAKHGAFNSDHLASVPDVSSTVLLLGVGLGGLFLLKKKLAVQSA